ncbi:MAG: hypothetical protein ACR2RB_17450, partial [Gammaproteobacteria bacterium]
ISLAAALAASAALLPYATLPIAEATAAQQAVPMEEFDLIDLGEDYGQVSVFELVGHYVENPPQPEAVDAKPKKKHFGGC